MYIYKATAKRREAKASSPIPPLNFLLPGYNPRGQAFHSFPAICSLKDYMEVSGVGYTVWERKGRKRGEND